MFFQDAAHVREVKSEMAACTHIHTHQVIKDGTLVFPSVIKKIISLIRINICIYAHFLPGSSTCSRGQV